MAIVGGGAVVAKLAIVVGRRSPVGVALVCIRLTDGTVGGLLGIRAVVPGRVGPRGSGQSAVVGKLTGPGLCVVLLLDGEQSVIRRAAVDALALQRVVFGRHVTGSHGAG